MMHSLSPSQRHSQSYAQTQTTTVRWQSSYQSNQTQSDGSQVTVSAQLSTSYSSETRYIPGSNRPPVTYEPPDRWQRAAGNGANSTNQAETANTADVPPVTQPKERNSAATTILAFIEQRLATDLEEGASPEQLQSRLQAGMDGFLQGYNEALEQLKAMGFYEGSVKAAVDETYEQMMSGFKELADQYGLEMPNVAEQSSDSSKLTQPVQDAPQVISSSPADAFAGFLAKIYEKIEATSLANLMAPTSDFYSFLDAEASESRSFSFNLRTQDGDQVTIETYADRGMRAQGDGDSVRLDVAGMENLSFRVKGELDADELNAISDLLSQVNDIADVFFSGDVEQAFNKALEIGFDSDEIARFSVNLTHVQYRRLDEAYGSVAQGSVRGPQSNSDAHQPLVDNKFEKLSAFIQQLNELRERSGDLGIQSDALKELVRFGSEARFGNHPQFDRFIPFVSGLMEDLAQA
ncbi:DUF5610 domain-containing protein [Teredinibacter turnerae]|uniref:DUF5610 domain-containing protein n=1 Tax=Teredinibacter turnerae TaxID=2426 RepID=UPI00038107B3|nr:DUF5610 domain-containing protein [Teredinibacter turnerae]